MMHLAIRTASRLPRPWIGQAFTAAPPTAVRHSSTTSADEFVKETVGIQNSRRADGAKKQSPKVVRRIKIRDKRTPLMENQVPTTLSHDSPIKTTGPLVRKHFINYRPWKRPAQTWPEKPLAVFSRRRALNLRGLPLATTTKDIILSIDAAVREHGVAQRSALIADIVIRPGSDRSKEVDAVVDFMHPDGALAFRDLAMHKKFKVQGVVPEVSLDEPRDPSKIPQPSGEDEVIAQLAKEDRATYFTSPELRKIVRRTNLIYN